MHILSPVCSAQDARAVTAAGATEVYGGVMSKIWQKTYSNVASPNRREWRVSSMYDFDELQKTVEATHAGGARFFLTLNALYTEKQFPQIEEQVRAASEIGVDALIVADIGLLLKLPAMGWKGDIHISTGGTTFNSETAAFYRDLGARRVILPRQNRVAEMTSIAKACPGLEIECFILNRGCKNIDGFCTFQHGVNEVHIPLWWNIPKKLHMDYYVLNLLRRLPRSWRRALSRTKRITSDSACFLSYDFDIRSKSSTPERCRILEDNLEENFNLFNGFDTCGACALFDLVPAGICSVKIVGRSNPLSKKLRDVRFLRSCLDYLAVTAPARHEYTGFVKRLYKKNYGFACHDWCYYPEEDRELPADCL